MKTTEKLWAALLKGEPFYIKGQLNDVLYKWEDGFYSSKDKDGIITNELSPLKNIDLGDSLLEFDEVSLEEYENFKGTKEFKS